MHLGKMKEDLMKKIMKQKEKKRSGWGKIN